MNKSWKRKWQEALRSGTYKQGEGALLRNVDKYCCLGVLCDIMKDNKHVDWREEYGKGCIVSLDNEGNKEYNSGKLGADLLKFLGITDKQEQLLVSFNDNYKRRTCLIGRSFNQIADWIETNL